MGDFNGKLLSFVFGMFVAVLFQVGVYYGLRAAYGPVTVRTVVYPQDDDGQRSSDHERLCIDECVKHDGIVHSTQKYGCLCERVDPLADGDPLTGEFFKLTWSTR